MSVGSARLESGGCLVCFLHVYKHALFVLVCMLPLDCMKTQSV